jgi:CHU_C Type IX secretion signal domain
MRYLIPFLLMLTPLKGAAIPPPVVDTFFLTQTFCASQLLLIGNSIYDPSNPRGIEVLPGAGANGRDSVIVVNLSFASPVEVDYTATLCAGDTVHINSVAYHENHYTDQEIVEKGARNGCDSIINVAITVLPRSINVVRDTLPEGLFLLVNGQRYDEAHPEGVERLPGAASSGCDSLINVNLIFEKNAVYAPTVFRPGSGSPNDRFFLQTSPSVVRIRRMVIADRWGSIVYERTNIAPGDYNEGWDGKTKGDLLGNGIYIWQAELETITKAILREKGTIFISR